MENKDKKTELSVVELLELQRAKRYLENIMDNAMDIIVLTDERGYIVRVNKYFTKLLECEQDEVVGRHISEFGPTVNKTYKCTTGEFVHISDKFYEQAWKVYEQFMQEKQTTNWQSYFVSRNDLLIPVELNMSFFRDEKENIVGALAIIRVITERRKAEKEIREARDFLTNVVESSMDGIAIVDEKGYIISVNSALIKMCQFEKDKLIGEHISILTVKDKEIRKNILKKQGELFEKGHASYESKHKMGEEDYIDVECNTSLVKDDKGNNIAGITIIRDITERKRAEKKITEAKDFLENIFKTSVDGIMVIDQQSYITMANESTAKMLGYSKDELIGKYIGEFYPKGSNYQERIEAFTKELLEKSIITNYQHSWLRKDGNMINFESSVALLRDEAGNVTGAVGCIRDTTERNIAQEKLFNYQKQLKVLTSQLTLTEEKERRHFAEYLHDEIGQCLLASQMQLKLLKDSWASTKHANTLDNVLHNIEQMIAKSRSLTFEISSPILYELGFESAIEWLAEHTFKQYNIMVTVKDDKQEKPLNDEMRTFLYRAVRELLVNVAKHAHTKNAIVSLKKYNSNMLVCVEDNGVGFNPSDQYFGKDKNGGVGLFHIKERLEQFGGQLETESQPNRGTKITLIVPLQRTK